MYRRAAPTRSDSAKLRSTQGHSRAPSTHTLSAQVGPDEDHGTAARGQAPADGQHQALLRGLGSIRRLLSEDAPSANRWHYRSSGAIGALVLDPAQQTSSTDPGTDRDPIGGGSAAAQDSAGLGRRSQTRAWARR